MNIDKNGFIINSNINFIYSKLYLMFIKIIKIILHFILNNQQFKNLCIRFSYYIYF